MAPRPSSWSQALFTSRVIWFGMLAATLVYGGLILSGLLPRNPDPGVRWVFPVLAFVAGVASLVMPAIMRKRAPRLEPEVGEEVDPATESMFRDAPPVRRVVADPAAVRGQYIAQRFVPQLLGLALSEVPAIFGLLTWMMTDVPRPSCLVMVAFSAVLMLYRFPSARRWRADAEAQVGATIPDGR